MKTTIIAVLASLTMAQGCAVQASQETHAQAADDSAHAWTADELIQVQVARDYWSAATGGLVQIAGPVPLYPPFALPGAESRFLAPALARIMGKGLGLRETTGPGVGSGVMRSEVSDNGVSAVEWQCLGDDDAVFVCSHFDCSGVTLRLCSDVQD